MEITKLAQFDCLIAGSTAAAMTAALEKAQQGSVALVTESTCLYAELTETGDYRRPKDLSGRWAELLFPDGLCEAEDRYHPDRLKLHGEQVLRDHGVFLLYACHVLGEAEGHVLLAHKSGLYAVSCRETLDLRGRAAATHPVYCLHRADGDVHTVQYVPAADAGNDAEACFRRYEAALGALPRGSAPARSGTAVTDAEGPVLSAFEAKPLPKLRPGTERPLCENPLFAGGERISLPDMEAVHDAWDVIVVGGGTAGASAGIFSARQGLRTLVLDMNRQLGGTATAGGVSWYWYGWREGATGIIDRRVAQYYSRLGLPRASCLWADDDEFIPDLKAQALLGLSLEAGARVEFSAVVCGVRKEGSRVTGVYWTQGGSLRYSAAGMVLDCTGDGDVCMFAGADHVYGNESDGMTYWASLAQYDTFHSYQNNFSTMVHVGDPLDYTRFILEGRQRGTDLYDHGSYLAPRETRHIRGLETVTMEDVMTMRAWEDPLYSCFSNYDAKGRQAEPQIYFGLLPPNLRTEIPRGAVIPVEKATGAMLEGILVGGKAISCTHNAFPGTRMQPDLQRQGLALAALAGESLRQNVPARDALRVREAICRLGGDVMRDGPVSPADPAALIDALDGNEPWEWLEEPLRHWQSAPGTVTRLMYGETETVLPLLRQAYRLPASPERRLSLARLLLWHGDETGVPVIVDAVREEFARTATLPRRRGSTRFTGLMPDHGVMPEAVYLLNGLSRVKTLPLAPVMEPVVARLEAAPRDWEDNRAGIYCYCESVSLAAAASGDSAFIPLLHRILDLPELTGKAPTDLLEERFCMLRIALYAALHQLHDKRGTDGLLRYLRDSRRPLSLAAKMLLNKTV